jgi:hypothetical protein
LATVKIFKSDLLDEEDKNKFIAGNGFVPERCAVKTLSNGNVFDFFLFFSFLV